VVPTSAQKFLASKFGDALPAVRHAMETLAKSREPEALAEEGFRVNEAFRPGVPGAKQCGELRGSEPQQDRAAGAKELNDGNAEQLEPGRHDFYSRIGSHLPPEPPLRE
jgi:hypothetical protein